MSDADEIAALANSLVTALIASGHSVATAESCTGGWIAKAITDVSGSSQCFGYGVVSYSNEAKESVLGVNPATLTKHGAVSEPVVSEMAAGVLSISGADYSVAVSGVAGPDGGSDDKPVGTVWFAWADRCGRDTRMETELRRFAGDRRAVRASTVVVALRGIKERLAKRG
jgi:nicotinamide-nucleotide amidase